MITVQPARIAVLVFLYISLPSGTVEQTIHVVTWAVRGDWLYRRMLKNELISYGYGDSWLLRYFTKTNMIGKPPWTMYRITAIYHKLSHKSHEQLESMDAKKIRNIGGIAPWYFLCSSMCCIRLQMNHVITKLNLLKRISVVWNWV
jgi:hypothetical protein